MHFNKITIYVNSFAIILCFLKEKTNKSSFLDIAETENMPQIMDEAKLYRQFVVQPPVFT